MNKKEAIRVLRNSWFVSLDGEHSNVDAEKALALAEKALEEAKPYKAKAKALRAENKVLERENKALRGELVRFVSAFKTLFSHIIFEDWNRDVDITIEMCIPGEEYLKNVDPLEKDPRYKEADADDEVRS